MKKKAKVSKAVGNRYIVEKKGKTLVFSAMKQLAKGKIKTDTVKLGAKEIVALKKAARVSKAKYFELVDQLIVRPCKIDSAAKKAGLTKNTGYDPAHYHTAKALDIKV